MSYSLKYWNEFKNYYNDTFRIEILGKDFAGVATEIKTMATPLTISYPGDDQNPFNPIIGSQATVNILSQSNFQFIDLHNSDSRAHRLDVYKNSVIYWTGWILPDLFSEPYIAPPYPISITARCGLGEWKEIEMPEKINRLQRGEAVQLYNTNFPDLYSIIANYILQIDTSLILNEAISVYHDEDDTVNSSPLANTIINLEAYAGKTVYDVVSDILLTFGARIYQIDGQWWIVRIKEMGNTLSLRQWTISATEDNTFATDETQLKTFKVGRPDSNFIVNESPMLDILPAWKKLIWKQNFGKYDNIVKNGNFSNWNIENRRENGQSGANITILNWIEWITGTVNRKVDSEGDIYAQFDQISIELITGKKINEINPAAFSFYEAKYKNEFEGNYIFQDIAPIQISSEQDARFVIEYDCLSYIAGTETSQFQFELKTIGGGTTKYIKYDAVTKSYSWTTTPTKINVSDIPVSYYGSARTEKYTEQKFNWQTLDILIPGFENPASLGAFEIKIYGAFNTYLRLRKVELKLVDSDGLEYEDEKETEIIINENNVYTPDAIEIIGGDLPNITNAEIIYKAGYRKNDYVKTELWHERDSATEKKLIELISDDYKNIFLKPQFKLSVPILSQTVKFDSCIVDYLVLPKKYICASMDIDVQTGIHSGVYVEFAAWEDADWILDDGTWNDDGIWIDNDEYWNEIIINASGDNDITSYFPDGLIIETLPENSPGVGGTLKQDGVTINSVPHTFTGTVLSFRPNPLVISKTECTFNATINGQLRVIKIVVNL